MKFLSRNINKDLFYNNKILKKIEEINFLYNLIIKNILFKYG